MPLAMIGHLPHRARHAARKGSKENTLDSEDKSEGRKKISHRRQSRPSARGYLLAGGAGAAGVAGWAGTAPDGSLKKRRKLDPGDNTIRVDSDFRLVS
jgi:hypothetical protein